MLKTGFFNVAYVFMKFIAGVFTSVAKNYDMMIHFINGFAEEKFFEKIQAVENNIYVLVAVFMLFRITMILIGYLIDPDKVSDKQQGAGKLISRIIISLLLVIAFPIILKGVNHLQQVLLENDSPLFRIFDVGSGDQRSDLEESGSSKCDIENMYNKGLIKTNEDIISAYRECPAKNFKSKGLCKALNEINGTEYNCKLYSTSVEGPVKAALKSYYGLKYNGELPSIGEIFINYNFYDLIKEAASSLKNGVSLRGTIDSTYITTKNSKGNNEYNIMFIIDQTAEDIVYDEMVNSEGGAAFARSIVGSFASDSKVITEATYSNDCDGGCKFLESSDANDAVARIVENEENSFQFDIFLCVICGIAIIVFMLILMIEVVIRQFKMVVLNMLAPIAFVSYINPNDKVLSNWFQKYVGCFLDLFIKLLALQVSVLLIDEVANTDFAYGGAAKILFYIGIFIFAKIVPNFISDIFGLKNMGGTFKESMNALKTTAFAGTGALIGGAIGAASGAGKGHSFSTVVGGLFGGLGRGFASGSRGHILEGGINQAQRNVNVREARLNGSNWLDRQLSHLGVNLTSDEDRKIKEYKEKAKSHQLAVDYANNAKSYVEGELNKGKGDKYTNSKYMKDYRKAKEELTRLEAVKNSITRESVAAGISHEGITDSMYNQIVDEQYEKSLASAKEEYNKQYDVLHGNYENTNKGLADLAIEEYYNTATNDKDLQTMKESGANKMSMYKELTTNDKDGEDNGNKAIDVYSWESVKKGKEYHNSYAVKENDKASTIEDSKSYKAKKASQDVNKK